MGKAKIKLAQEIYIHKIMLSSCGFVTKTTKLDTPIINSFLKTVIRFSHDFCPLKI
jgi:hypothetical protein